VPDPPAPILVANRVTYTFGRDAVVDGVSLEIRRGEFLALVGPNGSGKTTLIRLLLGLLEPDSGSVLLFGEEPGHLRARGKLGYVPQRPTLGGDLPATVEEVVSLGRLAASGWMARLRTADRQATEHALEAVGLLELRNRRIRELSMGQQQRVFIARALASEPDLLILDEPTAGVDAGSQEAFAKALEKFVEKGGSVALVAHELGPLAPLVSRAIVIYDGVVAHDGPVPEPAGHHADPAHDHVHPHPPHTPPSLWERP